MKLVYRVYSYSRDNTVDKSWTVFREGKVVAEIQSTIRDLWMDRSNPGYSVVVEAQVHGHTKSRRESSAAFSNRSAKEARENRAIYVRRSKEWINKVLSNL